MCEIDWDNWTPTPDNINALPKRLKEHIHGLESLCDPAGIVAENTFLKDEMAMFIAAWEKEINNGKRNRVRTRREL